MARACKRRKGCRVSTVIIMIIPMAEENQLGFLRRTSTDNANDVNASAVFSFFAAAFCARRCSLSLSRSLLCLFFHSSLPRSAARVHRLARLSKQQQQQKRKNEQDKAKKHLPTSISTHRQAGKQRRAEPIGNWPTGLSRRESTA